MHKWGYVDNKALEHEEGKGAGAAEHEHVVSLCLKVKVACTGWANSVQLMSNS